MTHIFNAKEREKYFDNYANLFANVTCTRDDIILDLLIPICKKNLGNNLKMIDFGCGGGNLLISLNNMGFYAYGIEKSERLYNIARERILKAGYKEEQIIKGGIEALHNFEPESIDVVMVIGVFQYLSPEEYEELLNNIHYVLKKGGYLICSFQNALFDLFTFNKYTLDFYKEKFIRPLGVDKLLGEGVYEDLKNLITNPDKPDYSPAIARDNIYVRTTNPLTIEKELKEKKFKLIEKYFYEFHLVPRLIEKKYEASLIPLIKEFEVKISTEWFGHFMANAFVAHCVKI